MTFTKSRCYRSSLVGRGYYCNLIPRVSLLCLPLSRIQDGGLLKAKVSTVVPFKYRRQFIKLRAGENIEVVIIIRLQGRAKNRRKLQQGVGFLMKLPKIRCLASVWLCNNFLSTLNFTRRSFNILSVSCLLSRPQKYLFY